MVRAQKYQSIEIDYARNVMEREEKMELIQHAQDVKGEEFKLN